MVGVIIQTRVSSTRLPGKVLKKVLGKTLLEHQIDRVKRAEKVDKIFIATSDKKIDDKIETIAKKNGIKSFRGSENDVLDRYYKCTGRFNVGTIVRITGDCPLIDPKVIDSVIRFYKKSGFDYVTNGINSTFPDGMDVEVFSREALRRAWREAKLKSEREHVTAYIWKNPEIFKVGIYKEGVDNSNFRLTVDEPEDLNLIRKIFKALYPKNHNFSLQEILSYLVKHPKIAQINSKYMRNEGYIKSVLNEKSFIGRLDGGKIYLRELTVKDATEEYAGWLNDPEVNKYLETKSTTVGELQKYIAQKLTSDKVVFLGIFDEKTNKHIGNIKLEPLDIAGGTAVLGILIGDKNYWGRGIAKEAIGLLCNWAFKNLGLKNITLGVYSAHKGAIKTYERAGFRIFKQKGKDGVWMKLSAS